MNVGGPSAMLGLVAMATDVESMYAAVKALVCVVHSNRIARREMERTNGYQVIIFSFHLVLLMKHCNRILYLGYGKNKYMY